MDYLTLKSLHLVFMVTWFAGLFYIVRLYIYHREAKDEEASLAAALSSRFQLMEKRLWYAITWPSAVLCTFFGVSMLVMEPALLHLGYMHLKLGFLVLLWAYQVWGHILFLRFQRDAGELPGSMFLRFFNEVPTVILIAVVFIIIRKDHFSWVYGLLGILGVAIALTIAIKLYKRWREGN